MIDNPEYRNWAKLEKEQAALDDWRYRVMSAMLVASSAILVLSFAQPLSVPYSRSILVFRRVALVANTAHILACVAVLGTLLYMRKNRVDTMHKALQRPICSEWEILSMDESRLRIALKISVIFSFAAFAALAVALTVCGFLYS